MILDFEFKTGLVVGLEVDQIHLMDEDENISEETVPVIYLHLGPVTLSMILD